MFPIILLVLTLIVLTSGLTGCVTYIVSTIFVIVATSLLWKDNGLILGIVFSAGLALYFVTRKRVSE